MAESTKQLTVENWLERDPAVNLFVTISRVDGSLGQRSANDRVAQVLAIKLLADVPEDVRAIFDAGRAAMVYGHFYYPLFALGSGHVFGALDAALRHRCEVAGVPSPPDTMAKRIVWLHERGFITQSLRVRLDLDRQMRNELAHPRFQTIAPPGFACTILRRVAEDISALYTPESQGEPCADRG